MYIKDIIKQTRLERDYTIKEVYQKVGVSEATVSRWESGNLAIIKHTKIMILTNAFGISPVALFTSSPIHVSLSLAQQKKKRT